MLAVTYNSVEAETVLLHPVVVSDKHQRMVC